jgi:hypothetical protein
MVSKSPLEAGIEPAGILIPVTQRRLSNVVDLFLRNRRAGDGDRFHYGAS